MLNKNSLKKENVKNMQESDKQKKESIKKFVIIGFFAIAMAFVETTVVFYLRKLYYAGGFSFPLNSNIPTSIVIIEWVRETCTIIMLLAIAFIAAKKVYQKFAYFIFAFAVWDIFYYIWLKVLLDWPQSLLTWDVLFLIPLPWASPVIAPIIVSSTMIFLSFTIVFSHIKTIKFKEWILMIAGALLVLTSFIWNYSMVILKNSFYIKISKLSSISDLSKVITVSPELPKIIYEHIPATFNWVIFILGELLAIAAIILIFRDRKARRKVD